MMKPNAGKILTPITVAGQTGDYASSRWMKPAQECAPLMWNEIDSDIPPFGTPADDEFRVRLYDLHRDLGPNEKVTERTVKFAFDIIGSSYRREQRARALAMYVGEFANSTGREIDEIDVCRGDARKGQLLANAARHLEYAEMHAAGMPEREIQPDPKEEKRSKAAAALWQAEADKVDDNAVHFMFTTHKGHSVWVGPGNDVYPTLAVLAPYLMIPNVDSFC
jgi:hypothetical protein